MSDAAAAERTGPTRAVIIDDHQLLAHALALTLELEGVECHVPRLSSAEVLIDEVATLRPELALLDLDLGGEIGDGSVLVLPLVRLGTRVIVVTASTDPDVLARTLDDGAAGIIDKRLPVDHLVGVAVAAARGQEVTLPADRSRLVEAARQRRAQRAVVLAPFNRLSEREAAVLRSLADGLSVRVIAVGYGVSETTVRSQVRAVLTKLGVTSQLEAVALARRAGWR